MKHIKKLFAVVALIVSVQGQEFRIVEDKRYLQANLGNTNIVEARPAVAGGLWKAQAVAFGSLGAAVATQTSETGTKEIKVVGSSWVSEDTGYVLMANSQFDQKIRVTQDTDVELTAKFEEKPGSQRFVFVMDVTPGTRSPIKLFGSQDPDNVDVTLHFEAGKVYLLQGALVSRFNKTVGLGENRYEVNLKIVENQSAAVALVSYVGDGRVLATSVGDINRGLSKHDGQPWNGELVLATSLTDYATAIQNSSLSPLSFAANGSVSAVGGENASATSGFSEEFVANFAAKLTFTGSWTHDDQTTPYIRIADTTLGAGNWVIKLDKSGPNLNQVTQTIDLIAGHRYIVAGGAVVNHGHAELPGQGAYNVSVKFAPKTP